MPRTLVLVSLLSAFSGYLPAQQTQISGPVEGFIFDSPTGSFRPVIGLPGSASLGGGILANFEGGSVAPRQNYALGFREGTCALVSGLGSGNVSVSVLPGAFESPDGVSWSADGSVAVLVSRSKNWIRVLGGLPGSPSVADAIDLSFLAGSLSAIAVDGNGKRIAVGVSGESGGVYLITEGGSPALILSSPKPAGLAFSSDGRELYWVDGVSLQLTAFQVADFAVRSFPLEGLTDPVAIRAGRDAENRRVWFVAGRNDYLLRVYDAETLVAVTDIPLDFQPSELGDFGRNSFLMGVRKSANEPLWLFTTNPKSAVYFVPAATSAPGESQ